MRKNYHYHVLEERVAIKQPRRLRGTFNYYRYFKSEQERESSMLITEGCLHLLETTQCHQVFHEMIQQLFSEPTLLRYQQELKAAFWTIGLGRHHKVTLTCKSRANVKICLKTFTCPDIEHDLLFIPGVTLWTTAFCSKDDSSTREWLTLFPRES